MKKFWVSFLTVIATFSVIGLFVCTGFYIGKNARESKSYFLATEVAELSTPVVEEETLAPAINEILVFQKFTAEYWESDLSLTEIESMLVELGEIISYDLGLQSTPKIQAIYEKSKGWTGVYKTQQHLIQINFYKVFQSNAPYQTAIEFLAHELRHDFQRERSDSGYSTPLEISWRNYVSSDEDYTTYYHQACEVDAREYGSYFSEYVARQNKGYKK